MQSTTYTPEFRAEAVKLVLAQRRCGGSEASQRSASVRKMMVRRLSFFAANYPALISA